MVLKRITKEYGEFASDPPEGCSLVTGDNDDILKWRITMKGPPDSPYQDFLLHIVVELQADYPFKAPSLYFSSPIIHPNINDFNDGKAPICLGMLKAEEWKPSRSIRAVLDSTRDVLANPVIDDPVNTALAQLCRDDPDAYYREVRGFLEKAAEVQH